MAEHQQPSTTDKVVKGVTAGTLGGLLLLLSGLTLVGVVITMAVVTPLLVIFSPVLVPAVIFVFLLVAGFVTTGGLGVAALYVLSWLRKFVTGNHPPGAEQLERARAGAGAQLASKAGEVEESAKTQTSQINQSPLTSLSPAAAVTPGSERVVA